MAYRAVGRVSVVQFCLIRSTCVDLFCYQFCCHILGATLDGVTHTATYGKLIHKLIHKLSTYLDAD